MNVITEGRVHPHLLRFRHSEQVDFRSGRVRERISARSYHFLETVVTLCGADVTTPKWPAVDSIRA